MPIFLVYIFCTVYLYFGVCLRYSFQFIRKWNRGHADNLLFKWITHFAVDLRRYFLSRMFINSNPEREAIIIASQYIVNIVIDHTSAKQHLIHRLHLLKQTKRPKSHRQHDNHIVLIDLCVQFIFGIQTVYWFFTLIHMQAPDTFTSSFSMWIACISLSMASAKATTIAKNHSLLCFALLCAEI